MTKEEYIKKIICEHWYGFISWKGKKWDDGKKQIWLSGMHRAWNLLYSSDKIEPLGIVRKITMWSREEAEIWYADYLSEEEEDDGSIKSRAEILDIR